MVLSLIIVMMVIRILNGFFPKAAAKGSFKKSAAIKDCHQRLPKVLLKTAQSSAEVMAVFTDCHQRLPKVLLK